MEKNKDLKEQIANSEVQLKALKMTQIDLPNKYRPYEPDQSLLDEISNYVFEGKTNFTPGKTYEIVWKFFAVPQNLGPNVFLGFAKDNVYPQDKTDKKENEVCLVFRRPDGEIGHCTQYNVLPDEPFKNFYGMMCNDPHSGKYYRFKEIA